jgi:RimJ/RimL family protein N-acetyltransferase
VRLEEGKGGRGRGERTESRYWHIYVAERRVGHVYVDVVDEEPIGRHASIQIRVNKDQHGRGIGRVAYRLASERSGYDEIYAHMSKINAASRKAAAAAGYTVVQHPRVRQLLMRWTSPTRR